MSARRSMLAALFPCMVVQGLGVSLRAAPGAGTQDVHQSLNLTKGGRPPTEHVVSFPQFSRPLDVYQGFNFKKDKQTAVGYVTSLKIGDVVFDADFTSIIFPNATGTLNKAIAVMNHILWNTGVNDAIYFSAQVSAASRDKLIAYLGSPKSKDVVFRLTVFEYDPLQKKYFASLGTQQDLQGVIEVNGSEMICYVADDPSHEVQSPKNFTLQIGIKPAAFAQTLNLATGAAGKVVNKQWGQ